MRLQAERLNDHHPEHNATFAFLYGPLVLAGVHLTSDIFVPRGGQVLSAQTHTRSPMRTGPCNLNAVRLLAPR